MYAELGMYDANGSELPTSLGECAEERAPG